MFIPGFFWLFLCVFLWFFNNDGVVCGGCGGGGCCGVLMNVF